MMNGPYDITEQPDLQNRTDLGVVRVETPAGMGLVLHGRIRIGQYTTAELSTDNSSLEFCVLAAPRGQKLWDGIREEILDAARAEGAIVKQGSGPFGDDATVIFPHGNEDGTERSVHYYGIDGPRWFFQAALTGQAVKNEALAQPFIDAISTMVIDRGREARVPRDVVPFTVDEEVDTTPTMPDPLKRGPEITEIH